MEATRRSRATPRLVVGVFILLLGVLFTLDNLDVLEAESFIRYWPVVLFVLARATQSRGAPGRAWGAIIPGIRHAPRGENVCHRWVRRAAGAIPPFPSGRNPTS